MSFAPGEWPTAGADWLGASSVDGCSGAGLISPVGLIKMSGPNCSFRCTLVLVHLELLALRFRREIGGLAMRPAKVDPENGARIGPDKLVAHPREPNRGARVS
jgi:hypothetical protein